MNKMYSCHVRTKSFSTERKVEFHIMQCHRKPSVEKKSVTLDEICEKTQDDFCNKKSIQRANQRTP